MTERPIGEEQIPEAVSAQVVDIPEVEPYLDRIQSWRERVLRVMLTIILVIGIPMLVVNAQRFIQSGSYLFLGFSILATIFVLGITILGERTPYIFRTLSILVVAWGFSILSFQIYGLSGDGRMWLIFFVIFTTIMLGIRPGIYAIVAAVFTFITLGYFILNGFLPIQSEEAYEYTYSIGSWISTGLTTLFISVVLTFSIGLLLQGLENSLRELQQSFNSMADLSTELRKEHRNLESRSVDLERRVTQIRTAAEISRSLGTLLDTENLINNVANLLQERFNLYYVGVFLVDENRRFAVLRAGTGEAGQRMLDEEHRLSVGGSSMVGWAVAHGQPRIALDVGREAIRFKNPHLPLTRSELALPLKIGNQVIGALSVQSVRAEAFDEDDITVMQGISDSLAIALENARLFQQIETSLKEIQHLSREFSGESWSNIMVAAEQELSVETETRPRGESAAEINVPLVLRGDQVIGNITMETQHPDLSPDEREFLDAISTQAALALESARLLEDANRRVEQEQALRNLTTKFAQILDFESLLQTVVEELGQLPLVTQASIYIAPPEGIHESSNGDSETPLPDEVVIPETPELPEDD